MNSEKIKYELTWRDFIAALGNLPFGQIIAGFAGSILAIIFTKDKSIAASLTLMACGVLCAIFLSPALIDYFGIINPRSESGFTFLTGMFSYRFLEWSFKVAEIFQQHPKLILKIIFKRFGIEFTDDIDKDKDK